MLYAREVIELLGAFPGRDFRMREIVRHVSRAGTLTPKQRLAMRMAIMRVIQQLAESQMVLIRPPRAGNGGYALYRWRDKSDT